MSKAISFDTVGSTIKKNMEKMTLDGERIGQALSDATQNGICDSSESPMEPVTKRKGLKKMPVTVYLLEEEMDKLDKIFVQAILDKKKRDRSSIMAEALNLLYGKKHQDT